MPDHHVWMRRPLRAHQAMFLLLLTLAPWTVCTQTTDMQQPEGFSYIIRPSFGFLMNTIPKEEREEISMSMYGQLRSQYTLGMGRLRLKTYLNADLIREVYSDAAPVIMRDNLVVTAIPSVRISDDWKISVFLEVTMETQMLHGMQDGIPTRFMDPAFFYETIYIGRWIERATADNSTRLSARYGIGYAFQQTMRSQFMLTDERPINIDPENPLTVVRTAPSVRLESGISAVAALEYFTTFSKDFTGYLQALGVSLSKGSFREFFEKSHAVAQIGAGLTYRTFSLRYDFRLIYDRNYSKRRDLTQSATFGVILEFTN